MVKKIQQSFGLRLAVAVLILLVASILAIQKYQKPVAKTKAAPDNIIINELMYHAVSDLDNDDYIELYNPTGSTIDISGWCFTAGITGCFGGNTTVAAGQYIIAAKNIAQAQTTYGVTAVLEYGGNLSNSGETVTLTDNSSAVVDTLTYSDHSPWPASPDGSGPSLELKDPNLDNSLYSSWSASLSSGGTPTTQNSVVNSNLPTVTIQNKPSGIAANTAASVTANIENAATVELTYKVNFELEQTLTMYDDGAHNDGAADDGLFGIDIPGQSAGKLVRYKVTATSIGGSATAPSNDDSIDYFGYVVQDPSQTGTTPILQWFIDDTDYTNLLAENVANEVYYPCVIAYGDQVFDNSQVRLKGEYSVTFPKKPFKVKLPSGYYIEMPGTLTTPLNEFHLNSDFPNNNYVVSLTSWRAFELAGFDIPQMQKVQLQRNGSFEGAYTLAEKYDKEWRARKPFFDSGNLYEDFWEKKHPSDDDRADIEDWKSNMLASFDDTKKAYVRDNNNLPNIINFMAVAAVMRHHDWSSESNVLEHHDTSHSGRWSIYPWDLDLSMTALIPPENPWAGAGDMIDPSDTTDYITPEMRFFATAVWEDPELKAMYQRRIRTLVEKIYGTGWVQDTVDSEYAKAQTAAEQDYTKWFNYEMTNQFQPIKDYITGLGFDPDSQAVVEIFTENYSGLQIEDLPDPVTAIEPFTPANRMAILKSQLGIRRDVFLGDYVNRGLIPTAQPSDAKVVFNELNYNPAGGDQHEFIELYNPSDYAVDISDWQIPQINYTFAGGSVIAAHSIALIVKDDPAFRAQYGGGKLILGEYTTELPNDTATLQLTNTNSAVVDTAAYGITNSESSSNSSANRQTDSGSVSAFLSNFVPTTEPTPGLPNPGQCTNPESCKTSLSPTVASSATTQLSLLNLLLQNKVLIVAVFVVAIAAGGFAGIKFYKKKKI